jgi:hypothetical protein
MLELHHVFNYKPNCLIIDVTSDHGCFRFALLTHTLWMCWVPF